MANRDYPVAWNATQATKEVMKWFDKEFTWLRKALVDAFHTIERRTGYFKIYNIPGGIAANAAQNGKEINGTGFGTTTADVSVTINNQTCTVTTVSNNKITLNIPALGLNAGDHAVVEVAVQGVVERFTVVVS